MGAAAQRPLRGAYPVTRSASPGHGCELARCRRGCADARGRAPTALLSPISSLRPPRRSAAAGDRAQVGEGGEDDWGEDSPSASTPYAANPVGRPNALEAAPRLPRRQRRARPLRKGGPDHARSRALGARPRTIACVRARAPLTDPLAGAPALAPLRSSVRLSRPQASARAPMAQSFPLPTGPAPPAPVRRPAQVRPRSSSPRRSASPRGGRYSSSPRRAASASKYWWRQYGDGGAGGDVAPYLMDMLAAKEEEAADWRMVRGALPPHRRVQDATPEAWRSARRLARRPRARAANSVRGARARGRHAMFRMRVHAPCASFGRQPTTAMCPRAHPRPVCLGPPRPPRSAPPSRPTLAPCRRARR